MELEIKPTERRVQFSFTLRPSVMDKIKEMAETHGLSASNTVEQILARAGDPVVLEIPAPEPDPEPVKVVMKEVWINQKTAQAVLRKPDYLGRLSLALELMPPDKIRKKLRALGKTADISHLVKEVKA